MTLRYADFVDYSKLDPVKRMALELFEPTLVYPERLRIRIVPETLCQTTVGFDFSGIGDSDFILTGNIEGLGTISRVANQHGLKAHRLGYVDRGERKVLMPFSENGKQVVYRP